MYRNTVQNPHENVLKDNSFIKCKQNGCPTVCCVCKANAVGMTVFILLTLNLIEDISV